MPHTANNQPSRTCMKYSQKHSIGSKTVKNSLKPSKFFKKGWKCQKLYSNLGVILCQEKKARIFILPS